MTAFSPQLLTVMQDMSGWVLAGRCADAAAALGRWSEIQPDLAPVSAAANAIVGLPTGTNFQKNGLLKVLTAPETASVLAAVPAKDVPALDRAFRREGSWGLYGPEQALLNLVQGVFETDSQAVTKAMISGVVEAGGLGDLALALERAKGGLSDRDHERTSDKLHGLTARFRVLAPRYERSIRNPEVLLSVLTSKAMISEGASQFVRAHGSPDLFRELNVICGLLHYLQDHVHASLSRGGQALLTDLLQISDARGPASAGRCLSTSVLTAHIAHAVGVRVDALSHNCTQLSLSLRDTPLVVDTTPRSVVFRTEDDWKSMGLLGKGQRPGPLGDLLGGYVNAVVGLMADKVKNVGFLREGFEAALKLAPNHFTTLINKAYLERGNPEESRRIVERLSRLDPKSPWLPFLEAYILRAQGRRREAKTTFEFALRVFREEGRKLLDNLPVSVVANEAIDLALDDFIALCVEDDDPMRALVLLAQFSNDPDETIRQQALLLMMALRGGGAQA